MELLHHADGTFMSDPLGLQIFNCVAQVVEKQRKQEPCIHSP